MGEGADIPVKWADIGPAPRAHLVMLDGSDWVLSLCGKHFPAKDAYPGPDERPRCKTCERREGRLTR